MERRFGCILRATEPSTGNGRTVWETEWRAKEVSSFALSVNELLYEKMVIVRNCQTWTAEAWIGSCVGFCYSSFNSKISCERFCKLKDALTIIPDRAPFLTRMLILTVFDLITTYIYFKNTGKMYNVYLYILRVHLKKWLANDISNDAYEMFVCCFLCFFLKTYVVGTHLNCIDKSMQFK